MSRISAKFRQSTLSRFEDNLLAFVYTAYESQQVEVPHYSLSSHAQHLH